jgi:asparagine synthase (glutamine-hydrolysing)
VPFLDRRITEFAARLDTPLLSPFRGPDKLVLRHALDELLPAGTVPQNKRGFNTPVAAMLRTTLRRLGDQMFVRDLDRLAAFFDPAGVLKLWVDHRDRKANHGYALWSLLTFSTWLEDLSLTTLPVTRTFAVAD